MLRCQQPSLSKNDGPSMIFGASSSCSKCHFLGLNEAFKFWKSKKLHHLSSTTFTFLTCAAARSSACFLQASLKNRCVLGDPKNHLPPDSCSNFRIELAGSYGCLGSWGSHGIAQKWKIFCQVACSNRELSDVFIDRWRGTCAQNMTQNGQKVYQTACFAKNHLHLKFFVMDWSPDRLASKHGILYKFTLYTGTHEFFPLYAFGKASETGFSFLHKDATTWINTTSKIASWQVRAMECHVASTKLGLVVSEVKCRKLKCLQYKYILDS